MCTLWRYISEEIGAKQLLDKHIPYELSFMLRRQSEEILKAKLAVFLKFLCREITSANGFGVWISQGWNQENTLCSWIFIQSMIVFVETLCSPITGVSCLREREVNTNSFESYLRHHKKAHRNFSSAFCHKKNNKSVVLQFNSLKSHRFFLLILITLENTIT